MKNAPLICINNIGHTNLHHGGLYRDLHAYIKYLMIHTISTFQSKCLSRSLISLKALNERRKVLEKCSFDICHVHRQFTYLNLYQHRCLEEGGKSSWNNVRSENKYTKRSSVLLLCLVYLFLEQTLYFCYSFWCRDVQMQST